MAALGLAAGLALGAPGQSATLYQTTLPNVTIGGIAYNVTFSQFGGGSSENSFNAFFGTGNPNFIFDTKEEASDAIDAILAALPTGFDVTPAPDGSINGFILAFFATADTYRSRTGAFETGVPGGDGNFPLAVDAEFFESSRTEPNLFSYVTFSAVPEPGTLALLGLGAAGLLAARRRRAD